MSRIRLDAVGGQTVVVKSATSPADRQRLGAEATWLRRLQHPGVVAFVDLREEDGRSELLSSYAGSATLSDLALPDAGAVAVLMAQVAAVVGDLHSTDVTHRRLTADHVVLGATRHPVLCSFAGAGPADDAGIGADLAALAALTESLLEHCPAPTSRSARRHLRATTEALAQWRAERSDARALAAALAAVAGSSAVDAESPAHEWQGQVITDPGAAPPEDDLPPTRPWRERVPPLATTPALPDRRRTVVVAALVAALVFAAVGLARMSDGGGEPPQTAATPAPAPTSGVQPTAVEESDPAWAAEPCVSLGDASCIDDVVVVGNMIRISDAWFEAGLPGDVVELGDWNCDGLATPALLRPTTGDVFVFSRWAMGTDVIEVAAVAHSPGASGLARRSGSGCDELHTVDAAGVPSANPVALR